MDIFHRDLRIFHGQIIVAEVPKALNAQAHQLARKIYRALAGDTATMG